MKKIFFLLMITGVIAFGSSVHWASSFHNAILTATAKEEPILFIVSAHDCKYCHLLENTTLSNRRVIDTLNKKFVSYTAYLDSYHNFPRRFETSATPTIWFLYPNGQALSEPIMGALDTNNFLKVLLLVEHRFNQVMKKNKG